MIEDKRLLRLPDVLKAYPVSEATWYRGIQSGRYPKPLRLTPYTVAWKESDIEALIDAASNRANKARR